MTRKRHWAAGAVFKNTPTRHEANPKVDPKPQRGTPIACDKCGVVGHTLVDVSSNQGGPSRYVHANPRLCDELAREMKKAKIKKTTAVKGGKE